MEKSYEIKEKIATLSINEKTGWRTEVNLISWYGKKEKYDIRPWSEDHEKMGKGITLNAEEFASLIKAAEQVVSG